MGTPPVGMTIGFVALVVSLAMAGFMAFPVGKMFAFGVEVFRLLGVIEKDTGVKALFVFKEGVADVSGLALFFARAAVLSFCS